MSQPYDAGNKRDVDRRAKASKTRQAQLDEAVKWMMSDPRGRTLMWERLTQAGIFKASFAPSNSAELTAFNEGARNIGLADLATVMRLCPEQYARMVAEAQARQPKDGENDVGRDEPAA